LAQAILLNKSMGEKEKLCKLVKKDMVEKNFDEYKKLVQKPTHICGKCGRASSDKKHLCDPKEI
jgi:hypothetical protein